MSFERTKQAIIEGGGGIASAGSGSPATVPWGTLRFATATLALPVLFVKTHSTGGTRRIAGRQNRAGRACDSTRTRAGKAAMTLILGNLGLDRAPRDGAGRVPQVRPIPWNLWCTWGSTPASSRGRLSACLTPDDFLGHC